MHIALVGENLTLRGTDALESRGHHLTIGDHIG